MSRLTPGEKSELTRRCHRLMTSEWFVGDSEKDQVAAALGVSRRTVERELARLRLSLDVRDSNVQSRRET